MIRYSYVRLQVVCQSAEDIGLVSAHLGVQPSGTREDDTEQWSRQEGRSETTFYTWIFDSPQGAKKASPTGRLLALADAIEPFSAKLMSLDARFKRYVDVVYHLSPQHPLTITGELELLHLPAALMGRLAAWNLDVSYEVFWFDHPEWVSPVRQNGWQKFLSRFKKDGRKRR